jgi:hypothetical protein
MRGRFREARNLGDTRSACHLSASCDAVRVPKAENLVPSRTTPASIGQPPILGSSCSSDSSTILIPALYQLNQLDRVAVDVIQEIGQTALVRIGVAFDQNRLVAPAKNVFPKLVATIEPTCVGVLHPVHPSTKFA